MRKLWNWLKSSLGEFFSSYFRLNFLFTAVRDIFGRSRIFIFNGFLSSINLFVSPKIYIICYFWSDHLAHSGTNKKSIFKFYQTRISFALPPPILVIIYRQCDFIIFYFLHALTRAIGIKRKSELMTNNHGNKALNIVY